MKSFNILQITTSNETRIIAENMSAHSVYVFLTGVNSICINDNWKTDLLIDEKGNEEIISAEEFLNNIWVK